MATKESYSFSIDNIRYSNIIGSKNQARNSIEIGVAGTAQMIRQYLKAKYPAYSSSNYFWIKSRSFANGNAIDIYLNNPPVDIYNAITKELMYNFEYGTFHSSTTTAKGLKSKTDEGDKIDYGAKYVEVILQPPLGTNAPQVDWNINQQAATNPATTSRFRKSYSSSSGKKFDNGTMIKECAGWEIYKKDYGKNVLYSAVKKPETPSNKTDWDAIKGEILTETGFAYKFGKFSKYGDFVNLRSLDELCEILAKYYQPTAATSSSASTSPSKQIQSKEDLDRMIKGLDVLIKMGNKQAEIKKKAYLIIGKKFN